MENLLFLLGSVHLLPWLSLLLLLLKFAKSVTFLTTSLQNALKLSVPDVKKRVTSLSFALPFFCGSLYHPCVLFSQKGKDSTICMISVTMGNLKIGPLEGYVSARTLEKEFEVYTGEGWRCSAHVIADKQYVMCFPNLREVDRALYVERITLKSCGVVVRMSPWSDDLEAEGLLEIAWVKIGRIPPDKRCDRNVAFVGALVGITLDIDMSTLKRPSSLRAKIGRRYLNAIPVTAEGCLGDI